MENKNGSNLLVLTFLMADSVLESAFACCYIDKNNIFRKKNSLKLLLSDKTKRSTV
jgi:hypothetical protein